MSQHFYKPDHDKIEEPSTKELLLSFIDAGANGDEPVNGVMQYHIREWFDELERCHEALREIRDHWACQYDHPRMESNAMYHGPYGTGVTDGHRAASAIAKRIVGERE